MRNLLATVLVPLALVTSLSVLTMDAYAVSQSKLPGFQEVRWGDSIKTVSAKLRKKYTFKGMTSDGAPYFRGEIAGYRATDVYTWFKAGRLYQVRLAVASQDGKNTITCFVDLTQKLKKQYGQMSDFGVYYYDDEPTIEDETDEQRSERHVRDVLAGRAYISAEWQFPDGNLIHMETIRFEPREGSELFIGVDYKSPAAEEKFNRSTSQDL